MSVGLSDSGWLYTGPDEKLLLWIPPEYRDHLSWPQMKKVIGHPVVHLDLSNLAHGVSWHKCFNPLP
jgi:hypothetical protein